MQENKQEHSLTIEQRKSISISGVESVAAFSEVKIVLKLCSGERTYIVGSGLKIIAFSKTDGLFTAEGSIGGVSYGGKNFAAKLFR